jgi:hypothetical protein
VLIARATAVVLRRNVSSERVFPGADGEGGGQHRRASPLRCPLAASVCGGVCALRNQPAKPPCVGCRDTHVSRGRACRWQPERCTRKPRVSARAPHLRVCPAAVWRAKCPCKPGPSVQFSSHFSELFVLPSLVRFVKSFRRARRRPVSGVRWVGAQSCISVCKTTRQFSL